MTTALLFVFGFLLGFFLPRDAFPFMTRLARLFMAHRDNRMLGMGIMLLAFGILCVIIACAP